MATKCETASVETVEPGATLGLTAASAIRADRWKRARDRGDSQPAAVPLGADEEELWDDDVDDELADEDEDEDEDDDDEDDEDDDDEDDLDLDDKDDPDDDLDEDEEEEDNYDESEDRVDHDPVSRSVPAVNSRRTDVRR